MAVSDTTFARSTFRSALIALVMLVIAALALGATLFAWHLARQYLPLRAICLLTAIFAALTSTLFLAFAMRQLDKPMLHRTPPWYLRITLKLNKRIILIFQLLTTALALASAFFIAFDFRIPAV